MNTPSNAVPTVQAPAASQLYRYRCTSGFHGSNFGNCELPQVPAGQTLFLEGISINTYSAAGSDPAHASLMVAFDTSGPILYVPMSQQPSSAGADEFAGNAALRVTVPASGTPLCEVFLNGNSGLGRMTCSAWGYLAPTQ